MQVLALVEGADQPCYRYRLEAFAWSMAQQGLYPGGGPAAEVAVAARGPTAGGAAGRRGDLCSANSCRSGSWPCSAGGQTPHLRRQRRPLPTRQLSRPGTGQPAAPPPFRRHGARGRPGDRRQRLSSPKGGRPHGAGAGSGGSDLHRAGWYAAATHMRTGGGRPPGLDRPAQHLASLHACGVTWPPPRDVCRDWSCG